MPWAHTGKSSDLLFRNFMKREFSSCVSTEGNKAHASPKKVETKSDVKPPKEEKSPVDETKSAPAAKQARVEETKPKVQPQPARSSTSQLGERRQKAGRIS